MAEAPLVAQLARIVRVVGRIAPERPISAESRLVEDLGIDSLDLVGVFLKVQDDLDVMVDEADVAGLICVGDLADYVERRRSPATAA